jgi:hypothetical protein
MGLRRSCGVLSLFFLIALGGFPVAGAAAGDDPKHTLTYDRPSAILPAIFDNTEDSSGVAGSTIKGIDTGDEETATNGELTSPTAVAGGNTVGNKEAESDCDEKKLKALKKAAASAYKDTFFDNDFNYLCDPCYDSWHLGERLKRNCLGDWGILDIGGQFRLRWEDQQNFRGGAAGITGTSNEFELYRTRLYGDLHVQDNFRAYVELLDAYSANEDLPPRAIDENRNQIQNLFGDLRLYDGDSGEAWARVGRQEMRYGVQRLVSPLDWANTRRTFEGYKAFWQGDDWDVDGFWVRPVIVNAERFDGPDQNREFAGVYSTYKARQDEKIDFYWLHLVETLGTPRQFETFGCRWEGKQDNWLWDHEAAVQPGSLGGNDAVGGMFTFGFGRQFHDVLWDPKFMVYYDWASGNSTTGGFNDLFPLTHYYLGFMDLYARRNIEDFNLQLTLNPSQKVQLLIWYHMFNLQNSNVSPFNGNLTPYDPANKPASANLGNELDLLVTWKYSPRSNIQLGYAHFWAGAYYQTTPGAVNSDADFFYTQFIVNF